MAMDNSTGVGESGYRAQKPYKKPRVYQEERRCIQWDDFEIGRKAKMLAHVSYELMVGAGVIEFERKFGYAAANQALDIALKLPGFKEWFFDQSGKDPEAWNPKRKLREGAYRLYQRVYNAYYNPEGKKANKTRASRSKEHYMHPSKEFLKVWREWAHEQIHAHHRFKKRPQAPRNERHQGVLV